MFVEISCVLPAFNEAIRLPEYLISIRQHFEFRLASSYRIIVVDDGSPDPTSSVIGEMRLDWPELLLLCHSLNKGKGKAHRTGVQAADGKWVLMAGADGATPIEEEMKLRRAVIEGADIAIGSRLASSMKAVRGLRRRLAGELFAWIVRRFCALPFCDTRCSFKMFRGDVAKRLFALCKEDGYLIDVEVLLHAHRLGYKIVEVPVAWRDVPGSKVRLFRDGWRMLTGLWRLKRRMKEFSRENRGIDN